MWQVVNKDEQTLIIYIGEAVNHAREEGRFEVRIGRQRQLFRFLAAAYTVYYFYQGPCSIWDVTEDPMFVEAKAYFRCAKT